MRANGATARRASLTSRTIGERFTAEGVVPKGGLEPPRVAPHAPQTCASANSATSAQQAESMRGATKLVNATSLRQTILSGPGGSSDLRALAGGAGRASLVSLLPSNCTKAR